MSLSQLDDALQKVVHGLALAFVDRHWTQIRYASRWTPAGDVGADDFWLTDDRGTEKTWSTVEQERTVSAAAFDHWRLTQELGQPRWYMMTVKLDRSGKYSVDFEYKDDYREGDIMKAVD
jgi:hypothetical protein